MACPVEGRHGPAVFAHPVKDAIPQVLYDFFHREVADQQAGFHLFIAAVQNGEQDQLFGVSSVLYADFVQDQQGWRYIPRHGFLLAFLMRSITRPRSVPSRTGAHIGISPGGMNATGESDMNNWYDYAAGQQVSICDPSLDSRRRTRVSALFPRGTCGKIPTRVVLQYKKFGKRERGGSGPCAGGPGEGGKEPFSKGPSDLSEAKANSSETTTFLRPPEASSQKKTTRRAKLSTFPDC